MISHGCRSNKSIRSLVIVCKLDFKSNLDLWVVVAVVDVVTVG